MVGARSGFTDDGGSLDTACRLESEAELLCAQGQYADAEPLYRRSLSIKERLLGPEHEGLIGTMHMLGLVYRIQEKNDQCELLYTRALLLAEQFWGPDDLRVATRLNYLAGLYNAKGSFRIAENFVGRSLAIYEKSLGKDHHTVALSSLALALLCRRQGKDSEASAHYRRAKGINRAGSPADDVAQRLTRLAEYCYEQGRLDEAELVFRHSLAMADSAFWPGHPLIVEALNFLAGWYVSKERFSEAEPLYARVTTVVERTLGADHPQLSMALRNHAQVLRQLGRTDEAASIEARAERLRHKGRPRR